MTTQAPSIFGCVEADAWSRGFNWDNYKSLHEASGCTGRLLSLDEYDAFKDLMNTIMENDLK